MCLTAKMFITSKVMVVLTLTAPEDDDHLLWMCGLEVDLRDDYIGPMPSLRDLTMRFGPDVRHTKTFPLLDDNIGTVSVIPFTIDEAFDFIDSRFHAHLYVDIDGEEAEGSQDDTLKMSYRCDTQNRDFRVGPHGRWSSNRDYWEGGVCFFSDRGEISVYKCVQAHWAVNIKPARKTSCWTRQ